MKNLLVQSVRCLSLISILICAGQLAVQASGQGAGQAAKPGAGKVAGKDAGKRPGKDAGQAAPVTVHHVVGTMHGFLDLRSEDGKVVATGDLVQVPVGGNISAQ